MAAPVMPGSTKPEAFWYERRVGDRPQSVREGGLARRLLTSREEDWGGAPSEVIVTQDLCDVCAVTFGDICAAAAALVYHPIRIVNLHPRRLDDIWADIIRVVKALGRVDEGVRVVTVLRARTAEITRRSLVRPQKPRVVSIEWLDPVMLGKMWMPELVERPPASSRWRFW